MWLKIRPLCILWLFVAAGGGYLLSAETIAGMTGKVISGEAYALLEKDSLSDKHYRIKEVDVTGYQVAENVTATTPMQTMTQAQIKDFGIQNLADALRRFAGVTVRDYGGVGGLKTVSVRNMGAAHTAISYDGIAVSNTQAGQVDVGRFSIENIASLSLSVGQSDDLLQSARACASAAILNIVPEQPDFGERRNLFKEILKVGSFGYVSEHFSWAHRLADSTAFSLCAHIVHTDGNYPFTLVNGKYTSAEQRNNSDVNNRHAEADFYHTFKNSGDLRFKAYYDYSKRGLPGSVILYNPVSKERLYDEDFFVQTSYKQRVSPKWQWMGRAKYTYSGNRWEDYGVMYPDGKTTNLFNQHEYYLSAAACYQAFRGFSVSLAQDATVNTLWSNLQACPLPTRYTSLTALHVQYKQRVVRSDFTLINTFMTDEVKSGDKPEDKKRLSPSWSVSLKPFSEESFYIRAFWKNTFRAPTFNDLYYFQLGNRTVKPEKATEYNLGLTWNRQRISAFNYLSLTVDGYFNVVSDKIVAFPSTYVWRMVNYGEAHIYGVDFSFAAEVPISPQIDLSFNAACTLQKAIDVSPESVTYLCQLVYTPRQSGNAGLLLSTPWVNIGYTLIGVGKRYFLAQNIDDNLIEGYWEHSLTLSHRFEWKKTALRLQAEILNLTDESYEVVKYYPMPGRTFNFSAHFYF